MIIKIIMLVVLTIGIVNSCFSQKKEKEPHPNLRIRVIHEWEQLIEETSIKTTSVDFMTTEVDRDVLWGDENTFIQHYKIASVTCIVALFESLDRPKEEFKDYELVYDEEGKLIEADEGDVRIMYYYDEKGAVDSTSVQVYFMGGDAGRVSFSAAKDFKTWDEVKGKTKWTRLVERELYSAVYRKRKKTKYLFLVRLEYLYFKDGLLQEIKGFDEEGKLKFQEKFSYTFYP